MDINTIERSRNNDLLDLVKLILACMVVAIHTGLFDPVLYPWLRLAVPLFFIISSYLFFVKVNSCEDNRQKLLALKNFVLRNLKLYAFWFIVLFPINVFTRGWFDGGFWLGIHNIVNGFLLASTFVASWFIMALIIGTVIVFFASKKINNTVLFILGAILFVLIAMRSSYIYLFTDIKGLNDFLLGVHSYESVMNDPINSFPAGIFWIICGKIFADGGVKASIKTSGIVFGVSAALLFAEWLVLYNLTGYYNKDFYIMLAPCALSAFNILIQLKPIKLKYAREMRKFSIIMFASHGAVLAVVQKLLNLTVGSHLPPTLASIIKFVVVSGCCIGIFFVIRYFENKKYTKWLKYSH